jgi:hypothetical protein
MVIWDKDKEDAPFVPASVSRPISIRRSEFGSAGLEECAPTTSTGEAGMGGITVTHPTELDKKGVPTKLNPVSYWQISKQEISGFAFSPDEAYCSIVGDDGCMRIVELSGQR